MVLGMSPEESWNSNPLATAKRIQLVNKAKNPEDNSNKKSAWSRKELLAAWRGV